jgi:hypothetical protein
MISTLIALPYELARLPLVLVDETLAERLPDTSVPRTTLDRTLGSADKLAGAVLSNRAIAERGAERLERSQKLRAAARREAEAKTARKEARQAGAAGRDQVAQKRAEARERVTSGLQEAEATEVKARQEAKARAAKTASTRKTAADQRATGRKSAAEKRKQTVESAAETKKTAAQRKAKAERDDARRAGTSASRERADAERLSDLADAKKRERTNS